MLDRVARPRKTRVWRKTVSILLSKSGVESVARKSLLKDIQLSQISQTRLGWLDAVALHLMHFGAGQQHEVFLGVLRELAHHHHYETALLICHDESPASVLPPLKYRVI